jgi:hypothetical protein
MVGLTLCTIPALAAVPLDADVQESCTSNPLGNKGWTFAGKWAWKSASPRYLLSNATGKNQALWKSPSYSSGLLGASFRIPSGSSAMLIFAAQKSGAFRYLAVTAGTKGKVVLGQSGKVGAVKGRIFKSVASNVPANAWVVADVLYDSAGKVEARINGETIISYKTLKPVGGQIGFRTDRPKVGVDDFYFLDAANPNHLVCAGCHAGQPESAPAPDVLTYWDGTWWDAVRGGSPDDQQGGHGDAGGEAPLTCTGVAGCHDLRESAATHRNGVVEGRGNTTANTYHLKAAFISTNTSVSSNQQTTFNTTCIKSCHNGIYLKLCQLGQRKVVKFGNSGTVSDGDLVPLPIDSDLTSYASPAEPDYAVCVSCHNPHGTGVTDTEGSNKMLRDTWRSAPNTLCRTCH